MHGNLVFRNTARTRSTVQGILSFDRALDESGAQHYEVYFGINETTKLENQSPLALIEVTTGSDDCGVKGSDGLSDLSEQIVNGKSAKKCEFKWQVLWERSTCRNTTDSADNHRQSEHMDSRTRAERANA